MALNATIYKVDLHVADANRQHYRSYSLTVARHPSETAERMMVRLIAFAKHATDNLIFTRGISETDEPDLWLKDLTDAIDLWVEVGHPTDVRILKACGRAQQVVVYCYGGHASQMWWDSVRKRLDRAKNLKVLCLPIEPFRLLATGIQRSISMHVNIQDEEIFVTTDHAQVTVAPAVWRDANL